MSYTTSILGTTALIVGMSLSYGCASTADRQGTGEYFDDAVITTKVKAAIFNEPTLSVAEINVETFENVVQLSGYVSSTEAASRALVVAGDVAGVKSVTNDMRIQ